MNEGLLRRLTQFRQYYEKQPQKSLEETAANLMLKQESMQRRAKKMKRVVEIDETKRIDELLMELKRQVMGPQDIEECHLMNARL